MPKLLEGDPRHAAVVAGLRAEAGPLREGGVIRVPLGRWTAALGAALEAAQRGGGLVRGLEQIEKTLEQEAHGLSLADERSGAPRGSRVSRLLLVSADGTARFYRQVERLLSRQGPRLLAVRLDVGSERLAEAASASSGVVRALLLEHKELVTRVLLALYAEGGAPAR